RNNDRRRGTRGVARRDQTSRMFSNVGSGKRLMSISMKDTILWNPSRDPQRPNYAFIESVLPFLYQISNYYVITLITPVSTPEERAAIISLLRNARLFVEGVIDERRVLFCESEVGKVHIIKHIGASVHVEGATGMVGENIIEDVRTFVGKVVWIMKRIDRERDGENNGSGKEKYESSESSALNKPVDRNKWNNVEISESLVMSHLGRESR
ncbi:5334_t:CDS:2, partial [Paraglomus occultum]